MTRNDTTASALPAATMSLVAKALRGSLSEFQIASAWRPGVASLGRDDRAGRGGCLRSRALRAQTRRGYRWGRTQGKVNFHGGETKNQATTGAPFFWAGAGAAELDGRWRRTGSASGRSNLMLINVSTRKFRRAVRLPEGDVPALAGAGVSKSAGSRRFVALSGARLREWLATDLSSCSTSWWCRSTASASASISCWSRRSRRA